MKKSIAMAWADLLESGKIKKAKGQLRRGNAMCCLGVACNMHAEAHPKIAAKQENKHLYFGEMSLLPSQVQNWMGMSSDSGEFIYKGKWTSLVALNDGNYSHKQLAQIIREHYKEL